MRKTILNQIKRKTFRAMGKLTAGLLLLGMSGACVMEASATEVQIETQTEGQTESDSEEEDASKEQGSSNQKVTYIYHRHIGNSSEEGGCFRGVVYHTHDGNETEGGECYQTPVYHTHTGNEQNGGGCYQTAVFHRHSGNSQVGGGCYSPVYHSHSDSCYRSVSSGELGCYVVNYWDTSDGDSDGQDFKYFEMSCGTTVHGTNSSHSHVIADCGRQGAVEGYTISCGKTETSIEGYSFDCEKTPGITIDAYSLDCEKTEQTIDGYSMNCGKDEETPCGKITVTEHQGSNKEETEVVISLEDMTGGELMSDDEPYIWTDETGNVIGTGDSITISENGTYCVTVGLSNEDISRDSLKTEIEINSIIKREKENGEGSHDDGHDDSDGNNGDDGDDDGKEQGEDEDQGNEPTMMPEAFTSPSPSPAATPSAVPGKPERSGNDGDDGGDNDNNDSSLWNSSVKKKVSDEAARVSPTPSASPKKETEKVVLEERESENEQLQEMKTIDPDGKKGKLRHIFSSPVVQIISITSGTLMAIGGFLLLCYLLFMTIRVYNDDGEGKMVYLGRCRIRLKEEGYTVEISDRMAEKAVTNRYCLKPGAFRLFKSDEEELLVCCNQKKVSAPLCREMIVMV